MTAVEIRLHRFLVRMGRMTPEQYFVITQDKEYLKTLVIAGTITSEQYKEITGEDYAT